MDITFKQTSQKKSAVKKDWHMGDDCRYAPDKEDFLCIDAVEKHVLPGLVPDTPFIDRNTKITAFGSCFAVNISNHLNRKSFMVLTESERQAYVVHFSNIMVHTFSIRQQFEWAFEGKAPEGSYWHGYKAKEFGYNEDVRRETYNLFMETDVFILTLGLSEVWYDTVTNDVFWRAVPENVFDPQRHKFRVSTVQENKDNLHTILDLIHRHKPRARVILTLSPIPLNSTHRRESCLVANTVSKAILRCAIDETLRERSACGSRQEVYYYPSYEMIMEGFSDIFMPDRRHVKWPIIHYVLSCFEKYFCIPSDSERSTPVDNAYLAARAADANYNDPTVTDLSIMANNVQYIEWLNEQHAANGDMDAALALTERAVRLNPTISAFHSLACKLYIHFGRYQEALQAARTAYRLAPDLSATRMWLGILLGWFQQHEEAIPLLEATYALNIREFHVVQCLAIGYATLGAYAKAEAMQREALAINPQAQNGLQNLILILGNLGRYDEAEATAATLLGYTGSEEHKTLLAQIRAKRQAMA